METGLCCRWISTLARAQGCRVLVGNARKLAAIWQSKQKNDRNDALLIARLARADPELFHPVELRDDEHHAMVQIIRLREQAVGTRTALVNSIRGTCKARGVFLPVCDASCFHKVAEKELEGNLARLVSPLLDTLVVLRETIREYDRMLEVYAREHFGKETDLLRTIPGCGLITACAFVAHVGNPSRFKKARSAGPNFGLTPAQEQSGESDAPKRISKAGSSQVRHLLMTAANYILREGSADTTLKRHGLRICARGGKVARRKAKVAVARKLAVTMLAMLKAGRPYEDRRPEKGPSAKVAEHRAS
jgi:transposase